MPKKKSLQKKGRKLDFTGVETGGKAVPDGNYLAEVVSVEEKEGNESGEPYLAWKWKILEGPGKGATVYDNTSLQPQALWRLRGMLESMGFDVPDGAMDFDEQDCIGEQCILEITNEKYNGKDKPRVSGFMNNDSGGSKGNPKKEEEEEDDKDDDDDQDDKKSRKSREDESDDDEDDDRPARKGNKKSGGAKIKVGSKVKFTDEDDNTITGVVTSIDGDDAQIEDKKGEEWEVEVSELELA